MKKSTTLLLITFLSLSVISARADSMVTFAGGDGVSFTVNGPALAIVYGSKNNDYSSWGFNIVNASTGATVGNAGFGIGGNADSNRPITAVAYLPTAGTYYVVGYSSQGGDTFNGAAIPDDSIASQEALDTINTAVTDLQSQVNMNTSAITALQTLSTALQGQIAALQADLAALQNNTSANEADLQSQIDALTEQLAALRQVSDAATQALQAQINSLSDRVTTLNSTTVRKSGFNTYLLYGATGVGIGGLGLGAYALLQGADSGKPDDTSTSDSGLIDLSADRGVPDSYGEEHVSPDASQP